MELVGSQYGLSEGWGVGALVSSYDFVCYL